MAHARWYCVRCFHAQFGTVWALSNLAARRDPEGYASFLQKIVLASIVLVQRHGCASDTPESRPAVAGKSRDFALTVERAWDLLYTCSPDENMARLQMQ